MKTDHPAPANPARDRLRSDVLWITAIGLLYFLVARFSLFLMFEPVGIAAIWPPSGIFLSAVLLTRRSARPYLIGALFLTDLAAEILAGTPFVVSLVYAAALAADAMLSAWLLLRFVGEPIAFRKVKEVIGFLLLSVLLSNALTSVIAASAARLYLGVPFWSSWFWWWSSDAVGNLLITPLIMSWAYLVTTALGEFKKGRLIEFGVLVLLIVFLNSYAFSHFTEEPWLILLLNLFTFSFLIWASLRFGMIGAVVTSLILAVLILWHTLREHFMFFGADTILTTAILVQLYIAMASIPSMLLAALFTERKRAAETLRASEELFRAAFENMVVGLVLTSVEGRLLKANPAFCDMLGYLPQELEKVELTALTHPDDRAMSIEHMRRLLGDGQQTSRFEKRYLHKNGQAVWADIGVSLVHDAHGNPLHFIVYAQDITERKRIADELQKSKELYHDLVETAQDLIWQCDIEGRYTYLNPAWESVMGYPLEEMLGRRFTDFQTPDYAERDMREFAYMMNEGPMRGYETVHLAKDGRQVNLAFNTKSVRDKSGNIGGTRGTAHDITERKNAEQALAQRAMELRALYEASLEVNAQPDVSNVLQTVADHATRLLNAHCSGVYLLQPDQTLELRALNNLPGKYLGVRLRLGEGMAGRVAQEGKPMMVKDYGHWEGRATIFDDASFRRTLSVPLRTRNRMIGALSITDIHQTDPFSEQEIHLLSLFADQAAVALENARLYAQAQQRAEQLRTMNEIGRAVSRLQDPDSVLEIIYQQVQRIVPVDAFYICLYDPEHEQISFPLTYDMDRRYDQPAVPLKPGTWFAQVIQTGKTLMLHRTLEELQTPPGEGIGDVQRKSASILDVPLWLRERVIGMLSVQSYTLNAYTDEHAEILTGIGYQAAIAIENAQLYEQAQQEIVERRRVEQALRQSEEKYRSLFESSPEAIIMLDLNGAIMDCNQATAEIAGRSRDQMIGQRFMDIGWVDEEELPRYVGLFAQVLGGETIAPLELEIVRGDNEIRWIEAFAALLKKDNATYAIQLIVRDITERKRMEQELQAERDFALQIMDNMGQGLTVTDAEGRFEFVNPAYAQLLGLSPQEILGKTPQEFTHPDYRPIVTQARAQRLEGKTTTYELRLWRADGRTVPVLITGVPRWREGRVTGTIAVVTDLTERERAEEALCASEEQYRYLFENNPQPMWVYDLETLAFLAVNHAAIRHYGYSQTEFLAMTIRDIHLPEAIPSVVEVVRSVPGPLRHVGVWKQKKKDATIIDVEFITHDIDFAGRRARLVLSDDVTERQRAEKEIKKLNQDLERRAGELAALNKTGQMIASSLDLDVVLRLVMDVTTRLLDAEAASVLLQEGEELVFAASAGPGAEELVGTRMPITSGIAGWVIREEKAVLIGDAHSDPRFYNRIDAATALTTRSLVAAPLVVKGVPRGVVEAINKTQGAFDEHDLMLLEGITGPAGIAIENARLFAAVEKELIERERAEAQVKKLNQDLERRARELAALNKTGQMIASTLDQDAVVSIVMTEIRESLRAECVSVLLQEGDALVFVAAAGPRTEGLVGMRFPVTSGIAGWVMQEGKAALIGDARSDPRFFDRIDAVTGLTTRSLLAVPLVVKGAPMGVVQATNKAEGAFDEHDLRLLESIASSAAIAIENARLYQAEQKQFRRLQQSQAQLIHAEKMSALGRLAASVAHEINNPLQAVQGCLALINDDLADSDLDESQRREHTQHDLEVAQVEINRIVAIVRRLRDFYRPAREGLRSIPLHTVLENLVALVGKQLQNSGIVVELNWDQLPDLYTNPDLLQQVFLNLALNAIDAMPGGGTLRVRTALEQSPLRNSPQAVPVARVEFSDTGTGIPPELLSRVFEPFFTTKEHGSGLGLSISYEIIESLGGEIAVTSQVGIGTTFVVLLPVREARNERINNNDRHNTDTLSHPGR